MQKHVRTSGRSKNFTRSARRSFVTGVCLKRLFRGSTNHPARRCNPARLEFVVCVSTSPFSGDRALGGSPETALANERAFSRLRPPRRNPARHLRTPRRLLRRPNGRFAASERRLHSRRPPASFL